ncbi:MAG: PIG-L deacetylase family protein [Candidatus Hodarchaeota archaeon]
MLKPNDRLLILAPHPDDEVLGCGGIILRAIKMNLPVQVVFFTYGDSNEWSFLRYRKYPVVTPKQIQQMGLVRHKEAINAAKILGLTEDKLIFLGYPDFGTLKIWYYRWRHQLPLLSLLTRARQVPYDNAFRPEAPYKGEEILKDLKDIIKNFRPTKIFVSHPYDFNSDHQALYLFTRVVLWDLEKELKPEIYSYLVHFDKWPYPRHHFSQEPLNPPKFLEDKIKWIKSSLTDDEIEIKFQALQAHKTQIEANRKYLLSFLKKNELFGDYEPLTLDNLSSTPQIGAGFISSIIPIHEFTEDEKSVYLGITEHSIALDNNNLVVAVNLSKVMAKQDDGLGEKILSTLFSERTEGGIMNYIIPRKVVDAVYNAIDDFLPTIKEGVLPVTIPSFMPKNVGVAFFIFGYKYDRPFEEMPKIWIRVGRKGYTIYDLTEEVPEPIEVVRKSPNLKVTVPLKILERPDKILVNVRNYLGVFTLDWLPWFIIEMK